MASSRKHKCCWCKQSKDSKDFYLGKYTCKSCHNNYSVEHNRLMRHTLMPEDVPLMGDGEIEDMIDFRLEGDKLT